MSRASHLSKALCFLLFTSWHFSLIYNTELCSDRHIVYFRHTFMEYTEQLYGPASSRGLYVLLCSTNFLVRILKSSNPKHNINRKQRSYCIRMQIGKENRPHRKLLSPKLQYQIANMSKMYLSYWWWRMCQGYWDISELGSMENEKTHAITTEFLSNLAWRVRTWFMT